MSRAERRAYQRMTRNQDPYAPPPAAGAAKVRMERQRARRLAAQQVSDPGQLLGRRAAWWAFGGAVAAFLLGLSLAWGNGAQLALLVGIAAGVGWLALSIGFAWWRRRARLSRQADARGGSAPRR
jgi:hypothetical protein